MLTANLSFRSISFGPIRGLAQQQVSERSLCLCAHEFGQIDGPRYQLCCRVCRKERDSCIGWISLMVVHFWAASKPESLSPLDRTHVPIDWNPHRHELKFSEDVRCREDKHVIFDVDQDTRAHLICLL